MGPTPVLTTYSMSNPSSASTREARTWPESTHGFTWPEIVRTVLEDAHGEVTLGELYAQVESHPKTAGKKHWQARLRQVLEAGSDFVRVRSGVWSLVTRYPEEKVAEFHRLRAEQCPKRGPRKS